MSTSSKKATITLKLSSEQIERLEKAAAMTGLSLHDYIIHQALNSAIEDIANYDRMVLSDRDRDIFMEALENPPKANEALKAAIKEHQEKYGKW